MRFWTPPPPHLYFTQPISTVHPQNQPILKPPSPPQCGRLLSVAPNWPTSRSENTENIESKMKYGMNNSVAFWNIHVKLNRKRF